MNEQCASKNCMPKTCAPEICATATRIIDHGDTISVTVPIKWRRSGGRKQIILPHDTHGEERKPSPLLIALSRAYVWNRWLDEAIYTNAKELAAAVHMEASMVRRILRLGVISPRGVQDVLRGAEPHVSMDRLMNGDVGVVWEA